MSATTKVTRTTKVRQLLSVEVDLGPIPAASHIPKVRVIRKRDGHEMFLNASEFGDHEGAKHKTTHYTEVIDYDPDLAQGAERPIELITSLYTADDLATMKIAELREVPEYSRISMEERQALRTKQDYVDAILAHRKPQAVPSTHKREAL